VKCSVQTEAKSNIFQSYNLQFVDTSSPVGNPVFDDDAASRRSATLKLLEVVLGLALHFSAGWIRCAKHSPKCSHNFTNFRRRRRFQATRDPRQRLTTLHTPTIIHNGKFGCAQTSGLRRKC
jgi:hypothetical protein